MFDLGGVTGLGGICCMLHHTSISLREVLLILLMKVDGDRGYFHVMVQAFIHHLNFRD